MQQIQSHASKGIRISNYSFSRKYFSEWNISFRVFNALSITFSPRKDLLVKSACSLLNPTLCIGLQDHNLLWSSCPLKLWNFWIRSVTERTLHKKYSGATNMNISVHWELELHPHVYETSHPGVTQSASTLQSWIWKEMWWEGRSMVKKASDWSLPWAAWKSLKLREWLWRVNQDFQCIMI